MMIFGGFEYIFDGLLRYFYGVINIEQWRVVDYSFIGILVTIVILIKFFTLTILKFVGDIKFKTYWSLLTSESAWTIIFGLFFIGFFELQNLENKNWFIFILSGLVLLPTIIFLYESDTDDEKSEDKSAETHIDDSNCCNLDKRSNQRLLLSVISLIWAIIIIGSFCMVNYLFANQIDAERTPMGILCLYWLFCAIPIYYLYAWIFNKLIAFYQGLKESFNIAEPQ